MTDTGTRTRQTTSTRSRVVQFVDRTRTRMFGEAEQSAFGPDHEPTFFERMRERLAKAADFVAPAVRPITGIGWITLLLGVAAIVGGLVFKWHEVIVIGVAALLLMALAVLFVLGRTRYRIELDLAYTRVIVGERALGRIEIHSSHTRTLAPASIEVPVGTAVATFDLPRMEPGDMHEDIFAIPTRRRAVLQVGPVRSVRADPMSLLRRQVKWTDPVELYVHPKTVHLEASAHGLVRDLEGITSRELTASDISFHALRDYVAGDDRRYVHWKSSARTGKLMVRQFEQTKRSILALGISTSPDDYANPDEFETAISVLGSLGLQAIRDEMDVSVTTSTGRLPVAGSKRLLDALSGLEWSGRNSRFYRLAQQIGREQGGASLVVMHAGTTVTPEEMRRARLLLPAQARVIVFQPQTDAKVRVRELGDAQMVTIDDVQSLPRILRSLEDR
ncbi:MAG: DUF58 domain-containing protein [Agrococcus casei]|uniref:DUF58 domain-containing protein n=3 Tax=Agrococcus TaxID=46352 RepID=A0A1R4F9P9_9MICO|nr:DUF58 domain-containing protein [Agrococcus casei]SJM52625.1 hypothetical protein CZ674_03290 [Agrococcus casei LMG 22410]